MQDISLMDIIEYIGIVAFALSGFYMATKHRLDLLGVFISSFLTALGGGITRDTLANKAPYTFTHIAPGTTVLIVLFIAILFRLHKYSKLEKKFIFIASDALGLVSFSITSSMVGIEVGFGYFGIVALGFITAVGGGVARDILLNEVPILLSTGLYGTISLVVGTMVFFCNEYQLLNPYTIIFILVFGTIFRLIAYYRNWHLPILSES